MKLISRGGSLDLSQLILQCASVPRELSSVFFHSRAFILRRIHEISIPSARISVFRRSVSILYFRAKLSAEDEELSVSSCVSSELSLSLSPESSLSVSAVSHGFEKYSGGKELEEGGRET